MNMEEPIELNVQVSAEHATEEDIDFLTRQLLSELRDLDVESAQLEKGSPAPAGSKGDPLTIGSIIVEVLPATLPGLIKFIQAWMGRGQGRTVRFKGRGIEFEGSPEDFQRLLATLDLGKKRR
jgi:hypothetical protein